MPKIEGIKTGTTLIFNIKCTGTRKTALFILLSINRIFTIKIFSILILILIFMILLSSCHRGADWASFRGKEGRGASQARINPPIGIKWKLNLQLENNPATVFNPPVVKGNTIYFGAPDGNFYAFDINSGYMHWVFKTMGVINSIPYIDGEKVYFGSNDGKLYAVYLDDGKEAWSFKSDSTIQSTVVGYEDMVVFSTNGGSVYFLSRDGKLIYRLPSPIWYYDAFQIQKGVLYFAPGPMPMPQKLAAFDIREKDYRWFIDARVLGATWYSFPAIRGKYLLMSTCKPLYNFWRLNYYALDSNTGKIIWNYSDISVWEEDYKVKPEVLFRKNIRLLDYLAPALWKNIAIYTSGDTIVRAFDSKTGDLLWIRHFERPTSSAPTVAGGRVYFGIKGSRESFNEEGSLQGEGSLKAMEKEPPLLVCLNARNGKKLWEMELDGEILSAPVIAGKWIIFGTDKNYFYVLEELY